jgi:hypothetical protein
MSNSCVQCNSGPYYYSGAYLSGAPDQVVAHKYYSRWCQEAQNNKADHNYIRHNDTQHK